MTHLILIGGLAAAGKTTLGREIAWITKFAFLDKDTLTQPLVEAILLAMSAPGVIDDRCSHIYVNEVRPHEYDCFLNTMIENAALGVSTIAVAPFLREMADSQWLNSLHQQLPHATIHKLWIEPPELVLYERTSARNSPRDRTKLDNWTDYISSSRQIRPSDSCVVIEPAAEEDAKALAIRILRLLGIS